MAGNLASHPEGLFRTTVSIPIIPQKQETGGETAEPDRLPRNRFSISGRGKRFSFPKRPDLLPGPISLLLNGNRGIFSWEYSGRDVKLKNLSVAGVKNK